MKKECRDPPPNCFVLTLITQSLPAQSAATITDHIVWERDFPNLAVSVTGAAIADRAGNLWAVSDYHWSDRLICIRPNGELVVNTELPKEMAKLLSERGETEEALRHLAKAVELDSGYTEARYNLGRLLQAKGKVAQAIAEYRRVIQQRPNLADAHLSLGVALAEMRQYAAAIGEFRETLRLRPDDVEARNNLEFFRSRAPRITASAATSK